MRNNEGPVKRAPRLACAHRTADKQPAPLVSPLVGCVRLPLRVGSCAGALVAVERAAVAAVFLRVIQRLIGVLEQAFARIRAVGECRAYAQRHLRHPVFGARQLFVDGAGLLLDGVAQIAGHIHHAHLLGQVARSALQLLGVFLAADVRFRGLLQRFELHASLRENGNARNAENNRNGNADHADVLDVNPSHVGPRVHRAGCAPAPSGKRRATHHYIANKPKRKAKH